MSIGQEKGFAVVSKEEFHAIGFKWEGTFAEAAEGGIRHIQTVLKERLNEIHGKVQAETLLGLSYHEQENAERFTHYAVVEVAAIDWVQEGMVSVTVPTLRYVRREHRKGQSIEDSYNKIYTWIQSEGLKSADSLLTHLEQYPMEQDPYTEDPEFTIMIPIR